MPADMKEIISEAARKLLMEKNVKKLTVKDIVEECQITRQAFYYHFADIPELFQWSLEKHSREMVEKVQQQETVEERLKYFFLMAIHAMPFVKKGIQGNYGEELERLLNQYAYHLFEQVIELENLYQNYSRSELKLILRYHSQAILGILREWTEEDTRNLDQIVHSIHLLMAGKITP